MKRRRSRTSTAKNSGRNARDFLIYRRTRLQAIADLTERQSRESKLEFGSLGPGTPAPPVNAPTVSANPARSATLETNPQNVITPSTKIDSAENDLRRDGAATDGPRSGRRTTLAFNSEQNRLFLQIVDTATDEVIEQIPSENLVALFEDSVSPPQKISSQNAGEPKNINSAA